MFLLEEGQVVSSWSWVFPVIDPSIPRVRIDRKRPNLATVVPLSICSRPYILKAIDSLQALEPTLDYTYSEWIFLEGACPVFRIIFEGMSETTSRVLAYDLNVDRTRELMKKSKMKEAKSKRKYIVLGFLVMMALMIKRS